ncbi:phage holin family protein, partial [Streptococcus pneumoniae]|uniref:phage holin family protein n=1 Tax=Streptococcus pneumoniae TaxID=1313 RepID=UPI001396CDC4
VWVINALALLLVAYLLKGIHVNGFGSALIAALVLGLVNTLIRPILVILTLPVTLLTPGLFIFILNALLFLFCGNLLAGFQVASFGAALLGSIL